MSTPARRRLMRDFKVSHPLTFPSMRPHCIQTRGADSTTHQAYANRSACRSISLTYRRQCHDLVCSDHSQDNVGGATWLTGKFSYRNAVIIGPAETPFEDGTFRLVMHFEEQYPNKPPGVKFISSMFHPNVYGTGELCLDILQNRWSPTYDVAAVLTSIQRYVRA